ncbi:MAG: phosphoglucosamine mutase, partial [Ruminococcaceae bacterium]|nr:phosphoglucosamine mutase [Oscillospiraceae bacterium]
YNIGGEQSGHVIFLDYASTGDGELTALWLLNILAKTGMTAKEAASVMEVFPQVMVNVRVENEKKTVIDSDADIRKKIEQCGEMLGDSGRVMVRASGTEPLIRVMLEGQNIEEIRQMAEQIAAMIKEKV